MQIEIISGSPRKDSVTYRIALHLQEHLRKHTDHMVGIIDVREWKLPLLETVFSSEDKTPEAYKPLSKRIFAANAFILVTPEYNGRDACISAIVVAGSWLVWYSFSAYADCSSGR